LKPAPFSYHRTRSVRETVAKLAELGDEAKILAGGQSLVPMMNFRLARPAALAGQLRGGAAPGIGGALLEEFCYDENGQPQSTTFMDYRMPTAAEVPPIDVLITQDSPAPGHPLGVRGAGEGGVSAAGAVLASAVRASAVRDALGLAGSVGRLPLTPARVQELATNGGGR